MWELPGSQEPPTLLPCWTTPTEEVRVLVDNTLLEGTCMDSEDADCDDAQDDDADW